MPKLIANSNYEESLIEADIQEAKMRMLYKESDAVVFMDDTTFDQISIPLTMIGEKEAWLMEETLYDVVFYKGQAIDFTPPTFMMLRIKETAPGDRGNTASGRVLKPAITDSGAHIQVPIFIEEGESVKVDTRTGDYVCRA